MGGYFSCSYFVVQSLSCVQLLATPWTTEGQASLSSTVSWSLLKLMSTHLILRCPLFLLLSILPSIKVFSSELALHIRWPKYWSFSISPSDECSGLLEQKPPMQKCQGGACPCVVCMREGAVLMPGTCGHRMPNMIGGMGYRYSKVGVFGVFLCVFFFKAGTEQSASQSAYPGSDSFHVKLANLNGN